MSFNFAYGQAAKMFADYLVKADECYQKKDYKNSLKYYQQADKIVPDYPRIAYSFARIHALTGKTNEAVKYLDKALDLGYGLEADNDDAFKSLNNLPEFKQILEKIKDKNKPVNTCEIAFTITEKDLIPEGMTYDPVEQCFYMGSIYKSKIIKIDKNGKITDFIKDKQDGMRSVLGMKVDPERRILWAASIVSTRPRLGFDPAETGWSGIFKYDIETGKLIKKYTLFKKGEIHVFNDLAFNSQGDVFITDTEAGVIYTISHERDNLELFLQSDEFIYPNGIALSPDEKNLFVAHSGGISTIDIKTKKHSLLPHPDNISIANIDGLYMYENSLAAVQNGLNRIVHIFMNKELNKVEKLKIIEIHNDHFILPTTGVIVNDLFYYIANSQIRSFNEDGSVFTMEKLKDVIILKTKLEI